MKESPPDFDLYSGDDASTFTYVCLGGVGVVAVASHLAGDRMKEMIAALLKDERARKQVAANGFQTIRRRHTCAHRAEQLMEIHAELASA